MPTISTEAKLAEKKYRDLPPDEQMKIMCEALGISDVKPATQKPELPQAPQTGFDELYEF